VGDWRFLRDWARSKRFRLEHMGALSESLIHASAVYATGECYNW